MKRLLICAMMLCLLLTGCSLSEIETPDISELVINDAAATDFVDIDVSDSYDPVPKSRTASDELYDKADVLFEKFGIEILIAEECELTYKYFTAEVVSNEKLIDRALGYVEKALSSYPEGFLQQLYFGEVSEIRIELVGDITSSNTVMFPDSYGGFSSEEGSLYRMVFDVRVMTETEIYHEIAHIIDSRLAWDAANRENAVFSEESWLELQPEGFAYAETYAEIPEEWYEYSESGYFVMEYSCRFASEDRATMMEAAMMGNTDIFDENPYLRDKLEYYSSCIRDCFNTEGWPEISAWENVLSE